MGQAWGLRAARPGFVELVLELVLASLLMSSRGQRGSGERQGGECVMPWQSWDRTLSEVLRTCGAQAVLPECSCGCFAGDRQGLSGQPLWGYQPVLAMLNV